MCLKSCVQSKNDVQQSVVSRVQSDYYRYLYPPTHVEMLALELHRPVSRNIQTPDPGSSPHLFSKRKSSAFEVSDDTNHQLLECTGVYVNRMRSGCVDQLVSFCIENIAKAVRNGHTISSDVKGVVLTKNRPVAWLRGDVHQISSLKV